MLKKFRMLISFSFALDSCCWANFTKVCPVLGPGKVDEILLDQKEQVFSL